MLDADDVHDLLDYDPKAGILRWRVRPSPRVNPGDIAGCPHPNGGRTVGIRRRRYRAHHLAYLLTHGTWPPIGCQPGAAEARAAVYVA